MAPEEKGINLAALSLEQLSQLKQALEGEVEALTSSYIQLRNVMNRFSNSAETVKRFSAQEAGAEMLVPLTNSLYVPGTIDNTDTLLVDVGTGYFIDKSTDQTLEFLQRKSDTVKAQLVEMEKAMNAKRQNVEQVVMVLQQKVQSMRASQAAERATEAGATAEA